MSTRRRLSLAALALLLACGACASADLKQAPNGPGGGGESLPGDGDASAGGEGGAGTTEAGAPSGRTMAGVDIRPTRALSVRVIPGDGEAELLAAIRGAKQSVHMTMYLLTKTDFIYALGDQAKAGLDVKVVLNKTFPSNGGSNSSSFAALEQRGVSVVYAPSAFDYTHAKCVLIDGTEAWIMTMNLTNSSAKSNREFLVVDRDQEDVADAERLFQADFLGNAASVSGKLVVSPKGASVTEARDRLQALIDGAKESLDVAAQGISDSRVVASLVAARAAGVRVRVVTDGASFPGSAAQQEAVAQLKAAGAQVVRVDSIDMHAKAIVADRARAFVGSQNFTATALLSNREIGVMTDSASEVSKIVGAIDADFAAGTAL